MKNLLDNISNPSDLRKLNPEQLPQLAKELRASEPERGFRNLKTTLHPTTKVVSGILENECSQLLKRFFVEKRNLN